MSGVGRAGQDGQPLESQQAGRKRSRITQACRRCKTRRARCDGVTPVCGFCAKSDAVCEWPGPNEDGRKRRKEKGRGRSASTADIEPSSGPSGSSSTGPAQAVAASNELQNGPPDDTLQPALSSYRPQNPPSSFDSAFSPAVPSPLNDPGSSSTTFSPGSLIDGASQTLDAAFPTPRQAYNPANFSGSTSFDLFASLVAAEADPRPSNPTQVDPSPVAYSADSSYGRPAVASVSDPAGKSGELSKPVQGSDSPVPVPQLSYLRPFGPTGIQPGLEQIVISVAAPPVFSRDQSPTVSSAVAGNSFPSSVSAPSSNFPLNQHGSQVSSFKNPPLSRIERFFEDGSDLPRQEITAELFDVFFRRLGSHFPFLDRRALAQLETLNLPSSVDVPMLVNSICALAARFSQSPAVRSTDPSTPPGLYGAPFADKAKSMLISLLGYPSIRTVQSLLLLSWADFGSNNDGSLWSTSGMALRMAQDLGLHLDVEQPHLDPYAQAVNRLTWWAVLAHDRMLSLGTGRPVTIKSCEISVSLPTQNDISLVTGSDPTHPSAFPAYCELMLRYGDICDLVNNVKGTWKMATPPTYPPPACDEDSALNTFRNHHLTGDGPAFLQLHLWVCCFLMFATGPRLIAFTSSQHNAVVILLYAPPLIYPRTKAANISLEERLSVVTRCCLQISQIISAADLVDTCDYEAAPFCNQCFFVASSSWVKDHRIRTGRTVIQSSATSRSQQATPTDFLAQSAIENFDLCQAALSRQETYWLGAGWLGALAGRKGAQATRTSIRSATANLRTFVSQAEMAVLQRLVKRLGHQVKTPELDDDALFAFLNSLQTDAFGLQAQELSPDDLAMA
ncbi:hypothetical protein JCM11251_007582 [Rhodosporidiobolus azoricus]